MSLTNKENFLLIVLHHLFDKGRERRERDTAEARGLDPARGGESPAGGAPGVDGVVDVVLRPRLLDVDPEVVERIAR